jgi:hypothetical protein
MNAKDLQKLIKEHKRLESIIDGSKTYGERARSEFEEFKSSFDLENPSDRAKLADIEGRIRLAGMNAERAERALEICDSQLRNGMRAFVDLMSREASKRYTAELAKATAAFRSHCESDDEASGLAAQASRPRLVLAAASNLSFLISNDKPAVEAAEAVLGSWEKFQSSYGR